MSFETIRIYTQVPIINGYTQYLDNAPSDKTLTTEAAALSAIAGSKTYRLNVSGRRGNKFLRLPGRLPNESFAVDPATLI